MTQISEHRVLVFHHMSNWDIYCSPCNLMRLHTNLKCRQPQREYQDQGKELTLFPCGKIYCQTLAVLGTVLLSKVLLCALQNTHKINNENHNNDS